MSLIPPATPLTSECLAGILHELRHPLSVLFAQAEAMAEGIHGPLQPSQMEAVATMKHEVQKELQLMDEVGEVWADGSSDLYRTERCECAPALICQSALQQNADLLRSRKIKVEMDPVAKATELPLAPVFLQRLANETIACALHLLPKGASVRLAFQANDASLFVGLLPDTLAPQLGDEASLAVAVTQLRRTKPIGLHLLQHWLSSLGGEFVIHDAPSGHAAFGVRLPLVISNESRTEGVLKARPVHLADVPESVPSNAGGDEELPLVLVADDQEALTAVVRNYLEDLGLRVAVAVDGHEAVRIACSHNPSLIIMDVRMPLLDGLQALAVLRGSDDPAVAGVPIVCVSGYATPEEQDRCLRAGATDFLKKPFSLQQMLDLTRKYFPGLANIAAR